MRTSTVEYEIERVRLGRHLSRSAVRQLLTDQAEYGGWELTRLRRYRDGTRDVWIRRKIIRVVGGSGRYGHPRQPARDQRSEFGPPETSSRAEMISAGSR